MTAGKQLTLKDKNVKKGSSVVLRLGITNWWSSIRAKRRTVDKLTNINTYSVSVDAVEVVQ